MNDNDPNRVRSLVERGIFIGYQPIIPDGLRAARRPEPDEPTSGEVVRDRPQTIISGGQRHGKTIKLIQHAAETGAKIIPSDQFHADHIIRVAMELGYIVHSTNPIGGNITVRKP